MTTALDRPLSAVVGAKTARALAKGFGQRTVFDLLEHYPRRYATRGELTPIRELRPGEQVTIVAEVVEARDRPMHRRRGSITEVRITDGQGMITLTFFNQPWRERELVAGARGVFAGRITQYRGSLQLAHPDYTLLPEQDGSGEEGADGDVAREWADEIIPMYPATSALPSWKVAEAVRVVLDGLDPEDLADPVPDVVLHERGLESWREALEGVHRPTDRAQIVRARASLRYREAFVLQAALLQQRSHTSVKIQNFFSEFIFYVHTPSSETFLLKRQSVFLHDSHPDGIQPLS